LLHHPIAAHAREGECVGRRDVELLDEIVAEEAAGSVEPRLDRVLGDLETRGRLRDRHLLDGAQYEHGAERVGKRIDGLPRMARASPGMPVALDRRVSMTSSDPQPTARGVADARASASRLTIRPIHDEKLERPSNWWRCR
jgi:hypothetical protein